MTRLYKVIGALLMAVALAGCGVRPTGVIDAGDPATGLTKAMRLYFVSDTGQLVGVTRDEPKKPDLPSVIKLLIAGPDEAEQQRGLVSHARDGSYEVTGQGKRVTVVASGVYLSDRDRMLTGQLVCSLARAQAQLAGGGARSDDVRVTLESEGARLGPYLCLDFLK